MTMFLGLTGTTAVLTTVTALDASVMAPPAEKYERGRRATLIFQSRRSDLAQRLEDSLGGKGHRRDARIERQESVVDRVHHRARRAGGAGFADALRSELVLLCGGVE